MVNSTPPGRSVHSMALDALSRAPRSISDLRQRLLRKGAPADEVEQVIERLSETGLLDDEAYARTFARSRAQSQRFSRRRLQMELAKRGIASSIAVRAIDEVFRDDEIDERANIEAAARKKLRSLSGLDDVTRRRRLLAYLARRGYPSDEARRVTHELLSTHS